MTCWYEGPWPHSTPRPRAWTSRRDRIVSAAVVVQDTPGGRPRVTRWLVNPGVPVPAGRDGGARADGRPSAAQRPLAGAGDGGDSRALAEQAAAGRPLVVMNAPFDLTHAGPGVAPPSRLVARPLAGDRAAAACWIPGSSTSTWTATARAAAPSPTCARTTSVELDGRPRRGGRRAGRAGGRTGGGAAVRRPAGAAVSRRAAHPAGGVARGAGARAAGVVRAQRYAGGGGSARGRCVRNCPRGRLAGGHDRAMQAVHEHEERPVRL